jgi:glutamine amidotransferase
MGAKVELISNYSSDKKFDGIILPGVGNFGTAINAIGSYRKRLIDAVKEGLPFLGICLGAQLIFEKSEEHIGKGLELLEGCVLKIPSSVKIPHMGWNNLKIIREGKLLNGIEDNAWVYFVHSYYPDAYDELDVSATTNYGLIFPSVIEKTNIYGTQFHPEKSGIIGSKILKNFLKICGD